MEAAASIGSEFSSPVHVAIIMDGNGRWARARGLPRVAGHQQGAEVVREIVRHAHEIGIAYLTIYAFSSENWKRPTSEVDDLMGLLRLYIRRELAELANSNVRLRFIGDLDRLPADINVLVNEAERDSRHNSGLTLTVALNYCARREIASAARRLAEDAVAGRVDPATVSDDDFAAYLATNGSPDPDLLIRTSGEQRLSNFLLWQSAYTELVFTPVMWPEFTKDHLDAAIEEFRRRDRRYGASSG